MDRRSCARVFGLMLLIALGLSSSFAQGTTSRVTGRVVDASGATMGPSLEVPPLLLKPRRSGNDKSIR